MSRGLEQCRFPLKDRCANARPELFALVKDVFNSCEHSCPSGWHQMSGKQVVERRDNYLFRFVLPVAELAGWPKVMREHLAQSLAAHLFWCFAWRTLDDVMDADHPSVDVLGQAMLSFSDALALTLQCKPDASARFIRRLAEAHVASCDVAPRERAGTLKVSESWRRSSQFFVVPAILLRLDRNRLELFRQYVNTLALAHDIHDLLSDVRSGTQTAPVKWLQQTDVTFPFRPQLVRAWFDRAATELGEQLRRCRRLTRPDYRLLNIMIEEAQEVEAELRERV